MQSIDNNNVNDKTSGDKTTELKEQAQRTLSDILMIK